MAGRKKATTAKVTDPTPKKQKVEEDAEDDVVPDTGSGDAVEAAVPTTQTVDSSEPAVEPVTAATEAADVAPPAEVPNDGCGRLLICGGTNWDLIGRKELPKSAAKNVAQSIGRNLWGPHALGDYRVKEVISSCCSCHSVAITPDGKVLTWGRNDKGQLGLGDVVTRSTPTLIKSLEGVNVVTAACGKGHTLFLTDKGVVYSVGENKMGQLGHGNQAANVLTPQKVSSFIPLCV